MTDACFHCHLSRLHRTNPLIKVLEYHGQTITLFVANLQEAKQTRFLSDQLDLCRCCRTLFHCADHDGLFSLRALLSLLMCFYCQVAERNESIPLVQIRGYRGARVTLVVTDREEANRTRFLTGQLNLRRCCRTLFHCADQDGLFRQVHFIQYSFQYQHGSIFPREHRGKRRRRR